MYGQHLQKTLADLTDAHNKSMILLYQKVYQISPVISMCTGMFCMSEHPVTIPPTVLFPVPALS